GGQVPVVPAVVAAEEDPVAAGGAAGDAHGHGAGLPAALGVAHHLGAGDGPAQLLGQLDLQLVVDRVDGARGDLPAHRLVHDGVAVAEDDGADARGPVDVLVPIDVSEARPAGAGGVDGRDAAGVARRPAADQLGAAGDQLQAPAVQGHRAGDAAGVVAR